MLEVVRSPAKVSWHLMYNGIFIEAYAVKSEADEAVRKFRKQLGLEVK